MTRIIVYLLKISLFIYALSAIQLHAKPWKGAEIITQDSYKFGAFEARIRAPKGSGMIVPFFLWKYDSELPGTEWQEQDFEIFGNNGDFQTQLMTPGNPRTENKVRHRNFLPMPAYEGYYTYRMEWTPEYLAFYIDGRLVRRETDRVKFSKFLDSTRAEPAQLRISLWAGDYSFTGPFDASSAPAAVFVEFVKIYTYNETTKTFENEWVDEFDYIDYSRWWFANWTFDVAINDYVQDNATTIDGKLVLAFTSEDDQGTFPFDIPEDNPPITIEEGITELTRDTVVLPSKIEAENFSRSYDVDRLNRGDDSCFTGATDSIETDDNGVSCYVGWTEGGEWLEYKVESLENATYDLHLRAATIRSGRKVVVNVKNTTINRTISIPTSETWKSFQTVTTTLDIPEGPQTIRIQFENGSVNLNYFELAIADTSESVVIPAKIEAEDFVDFFEINDGVKGDVSCGTQPVDAEYTNDELGGICNIGWTNSGDWLDYSIEVTEAGDYDMHLRVATNVSGRSVSVESNGETVGTVDIPLNGWQTFTSEILTFPLEQGNHDIRVVFDNGKVNLNFIEFSLNDEAPIDPIDPTDPDIPDTCNWYGTPTPMCKEATTGWSYEEGQSCVSTGTCYSDDHINWHNQFGTSP